MAASPPPKGLPGFLRRSLRNPYEEEEAVGRLGIPRTSESASEGESSDAAAGVYVEKQESPGSRGEEEQSGRMVADEEEAEEEDLKREKEAVEAAANRVNRKFRFGLSLGGGGGINREGNRDGGGTSMAAADSAADGGGIKVGPSETGEGNGILSTPLKPGTSRTRAKSESAVDNSDSSDVPPPPPGQDSPAGQPGRAGSSPASSSPGNLDRQMSYKELTFEKTINSDVVNVRDLRRLGWNGIPPKHRAQAWRILLGYLPANASRRKQTLERKRAEYRDAIAQHYDIDDNSRTGQEQETLRQVLVDVPRTAPDVLLFRDGRIRQLLGRLLYIWACRHPASSYVQGINDLATPLISVFLSGYYGGKSVLDGKIMDDVPDDVLFEIEADTYWCLTNLLAGIQDHYTADQPGVQRMVMRLEELVARIDADLTEHLRNTGIEFFQFAFKWMNCLLLREFNLPCVMRLWDTYLSEGDGGFEDFHVYVCAAFLCQFSAEVRAMEFDELFGFMQNMPTSDWGDSEVEIVLSQAFVLSTLFEGSDAHLTSQRS